MGVVVKFVTATLMPHLDESMYVVYCDDVLSMAEWRSCSVWMVAWILCHEA